MAKSDSLVLTRHDLSLVGIGVVLLVGLVVGSFPAVALSKALFVASIPAVGCIGYTLFYRPPVAETRP